MIASMLMLAAAQAAPTPPMPPEPPKKIVREIVVIDGKDGKPIVLPEGKDSRTNVILMRDGKPPADGEKHEIRIVRAPGATGGAETMIADCDTSRRFETSAAAEKDGKKTQTRIVLCPANGESNATFVQSLENAAKRISESKDMPEDVRTRVLASLNAEIRRLETSGK
jgi:hypothetical protein